IHAGLAILALRWAAVGDVRGSNTAWVVAAVELLFLLALAVVRAALHDPKARDAPMSWLLIVHTALMLVFGACLLPSDRGLAWVLIIVALLSGGGYLSSRSPFFVAFFKRLTGYFTEEDVRRIREGTEQPASD